MSTNDTQDADAEPRNDRFDQHIYNLDLGDEMVDFEHTKCEPTEHDGRPAYLFAIGPNDEDVRKAKVCTDCGMVTQEVAYDDVVDLQLEAVGETADRVTNYPGETELVTVPFDQPVEDVLAEQGYEDCEILHTGHTDGELLVVVETGGQQTLDASTMDLDQHEECDDCTVHWDDGTPIAVSACEDHADSQPMEEA